MFKFQQTLSQTSKRSLSKFFSRKSSLENVCSFLTQKEKFRFLCNSKEVSKELDSKIDDVFMPREYQEKIKTYENNYEDLFYQILMEMKRKAENKGEKIKLYEIEDDMVKYLKYLNKKFDKSIKLSLIGIFHTDAWKLDFMSKLILSLEKNVHLVVSMNLTEFKANDYYAYYFKPSKAINTVEIIDIIYNPRESLINDFFKSAFDWSHIKKIIFNSSEIDGMDNHVQKKKYYGYKILNNACLPNLEELDIRCENANFKMLEHFFYKCSNVKKLSIKNITFKNFSDIEDNSVLKSFNNITDLELSTNLDNLDQTLYYFYPLLSKIKNFHLEITDDEDEDFVNKINYIKAKSQTKNNNIDNNEYEQFADEYLYDDVIGDSRDLAAKKFSFTTDSDIKPRKRHNKKKQLNIVYEAEAKGEEKEQIDLNQKKIISTLANLQQCGSLTYEIKEQKALINYRKNKINDLINIIENNKSHLKYLDINIYNDKEIVININQFSALIQKISECKHLNTFILRFELIDEYAKIFNQYFKLGNNLTKINLIHNTDLNIMDIINEHPGLNSIILGLIMNEPNYSKKNYENYSFDLDINRQWKEIDLTNYPINSKCLEYLRNNKDIDICLNACVNLTEMDDLSFKKIIKTFI